MWSVDPQLLALLLDDHEMANYVYVLRSDGTLYPISVTEDSTCDANLSQQVTRGATLGVDRSYIAAGLLDPLSDLVIIRQQVPSWPTIPLFIGRPTDRVARPDGSVSVTCVSLSDDVISNDFMTPWVVTGANNSVIEMINIIKDTNPSFSVSYDSALVGNGVASPPAQTYETDRGGALDDLAKGITAVWMSDRVGGFTIIRNPFANATTPTTATLVTLTDGVNGVLVDVQDTRARGPVANSITVVVERTDNTIPPLRVTVQDRDPTSATRWGGPFGRRNKTVKIQTAYSQSDALAYARQLLNSQLSFTRSWRIQVPHMPVLDPGDFITVNYQGETTTQIIESIGYNLTAANPTELTTRQFDANVGTVVASTF